MLKDSLAASGFGVDEETYDRRSLHRHQKCIGSDLIFCFFCIKTKERKARGSVMR